MISSRSTSRGSSRGSSSTIRRRQIMPKLNPHTPSSSDDSGSNNELKQCNDCGREFGTQTGLTMHQSRWCKGSSSSSSSSKAVEEEEEMEEDEEEEDDDDDVVDDVTVDDDAVDDDADVDAVVKGNNKVTTKGNKDSSQEKLNKDQETTTTTTTTAVISNPAAVEEEEEASVAAIFELHYYVFNLLYMIGFMLHCRKYVDYNIVITIIHIIAFIFTSSSSSSSSSSSKSSSSLVSESNESENENENENENESDYSSTINSSSTSKTSTSRSTSKTSISLLLNKVKLILHEIIFTSFLGFVIYTTYDTSPYNANHHNLMGVISVLLFPQQLKRFLYMMMSLVSKLPTTTTTTTTTLLVMMKSGSSNNNKKSGSSSNNNKKLDNDDDVITSTSPSTSTSTSMMDTTNDGLNSARIAIIIMYFMAGFHKINYDFLLNTKVSCAFDMMWKYLPLLNIEVYEDLEPSTLGYMKYLPFIALFVELVPPILLTVPNSKVQRLGIGMLLSLHLLLLPIGFVDFGSIAQSFLWLFIPPKTIFGSNDNDNSSSNHSFKNFVNDMSLCLCFLELCSVFITIQFDYEDPPFLQQEFGMVLMAFFIMWSYIFRRIWDGTGNGVSGDNGNGDNDNDNDNETTTNNNNAVRIYVPKSIVTNCIILLFLFYTFNPYLGLRTTGCVNMFSNLRTEGRVGNHLLLGSNSLKFWNYQEDIITILDWDERASFYLGIPGSSEWNGGEDDYGQKEDEGYGDGLLQLGWSYQKINFYIVMEPHLHLDSKYYIFEYGLYDKPIDVYMKILYKGIEYETYDLYYDTKIYKKFIVEMEDEAKVPWYMYKYFDFRDIQPDYNDENATQECAW